MPRPAISYDPSGTPAIWAEDAIAAYYGIGYLHARHRPLQSLLVHTAGRGELAARLVGRDDLVAIDALAHRLDLPRLGEEEAARLSPRAAAWLDSYLEGFRRGLGDGGMPFELRVLAARVPPPSRAAVLSGLLLSAYLGLGEGQERMERAIIDAVTAGAEPSLLEQMFAPHLAGWDVHAMQRLPRSSAPGFAAHSFIAAAGGSNAWAVTGSRSKSGASMLCGDPHLQINQMPALFFELVARVGDDWWLGATIPGLPGLAVGRNARVAWSGTFGVADNVDFTIEELAGGRAQRGATEEPEAPTRREVVLRRRFARPVRLTFFDTRLGTLERRELTDGAALAARWAGREGAAVALEAYMALPLAVSAREAEQSLLGASAYSLHFVLADRGDVRYCQRGRIPKRSGGWSGLYPVPASGAARWDGFYEGQSMPTSGPEAGIIASANEARPAPDGGVLATLAQPSYRLERITSLLTASSHHDVESMRALQLDLVSLQAQRLLPRLLLALPDGSLRRALAAWDRSYEADRKGAHAFEVAYGAARSALRDELGGDWLDAMIASTELPVWWVAAFDRVLAADDSWQGPRGERLSRALAQVAAIEPEPWGEMQRLEMPHMILGGLPGFCGFDRGPFPLPGSRATVRQGSVVGGGRRRVVTAPAYRFICDLADDGAWSALPGGIDGSRFSATYDRWLGDYLAGRYHRLSPPADAERSSARQL